MPLSISACDKRLPFHARDINPVFVWPIVVGGEDAVAERVVALAKGLNGANVEVGVNGGSFRLYCGNFALREVLRVDDDSVVGSEDSGVFGVETEEDGVAMLRWSSIRNATQSKQDEQSKKADRNKNLFYNHITPVSRLAVQRFVCKDR